MKENNEITKYKISIPLAIVVASIILGGCFYGIQVQKQNSIEKQQTIDLAAENRAEDFENELRCQGLLKELKQRWNNVIGIGYDRFFNTCMVKYTDHETGEVETARVEDMQDVN